MAGPMLPEVDGRALDPNGRRWQIDKHIPLALILTIVLQTATIVWWAAGINHEVADLKQRALSAATQPERIVRLETRLDAISDSLNEIRRLLSTKVP
jgi:hypothetical protein